MLELDEASLAMLTADDGAPVRAELTALARAGGFATPPRYTQYRRGSAFLHGAHMGSVVGEREPRYR